MKYFNTPTQGSWPEFIVAGPAHALWFTEFFTDKIGRISSDGKMTEFPVGDDPEGIAAGPDGNLRAGFFLDILQQGFSPTDTQQQLDIAIDWGRYAELFDYDTHTDQITAEA